MMRKVGQRAAMPIVFVCVCVWLADRGFKAEGDRTALRIFDTDHEDQVQGRLARDHPPGLCRGGMPVI